MPSISILILTYNSSRFVDRLFDSIDSILGKSIEKGEVEVVVVDNDSSDNTIQAVKGNKLSRHVSVFSNKINSGYAKGINMAAKKAKGEILLIINPDAQLSSFDLQKTLRFFERKKNAAIAGLTIVNPDGSREKNAGTFYSPLTLLVYALGLEGLCNIRYSPVGVEAVDYVSGGFMAIRKKSFGELGGFDEDYFMYIEDMDLCYRAHKKGYGVHFLPYGSIIHQGQGSSSRAFAIEHIFKGLTIFYNKNKKGELSYLRFLLRFKAALIIFMGTILRDYQLVAGYRKAVRKIT